MIGVDQILDIIQIAVWSGALKGERPLSIILIASVGSGKTSMIKKTHQKGSTKEVQVPGKRKDEPRTIEVRQIVGSVLYTTNTTPHILCNRYGQILKNGQIKHIAIPDFLNILNLPRYALANTISFYNNLIEEGIMSIESRDGQFVTEVPVTIGLITTIAKPDFDMRKDEWAAIGFLSRVLPISFRYNNNTAQAIRDSIKNRDYLRETESFNIKLPANPRNIAIPLDLADEIEKVALETRDRQDVLGARRQKQLGVFCMANALRDNRIMVNADDVDKLNIYKQYFNTEGAAYI